MRNWKGKAVLVIGAARQGLAATRFLSAMGANVTLNDGKDRSQFEKSSISLESENVRVHFGGHPLTLLDDIDFVCISGGVPLDIPIIQEANRRNIQLTNDAQIFLEETRAKVIGITGSAGKTTTTTFIGEIAKTAVQKPARSWVGGNIGNPLIEQVKQMSENDWVVMELSSFQLELMERSPHIALVTNITPNHLDRHKTMESYISAKANILKHQTAADIAILNRDDANAYALRSNVQGELITFGCQEISSQNPDMFIEDDSIKYFDGKKSLTITKTEEINLPGTHNIINAMAACAAGIAAGYSFEDIRIGIRNVANIPHRLELVAENNHIRWINDSIATAPERVIAALNAIEGPLVLLLGGRDKDLPWDELAHLIAHRKPKLVLFGECGKMIENILLKEKYLGKRYSIDRFNKFEDAVIHAEKIAEPGESILLSPGGTSYDAFIDFEERGNLFIELAKKVA